MLEGNNMDRIFQYGLHEFLTEFIARNNRISEALSRELQLLLTMKITVRHQLRVGLAEGASRVGAAPAADAAERADAIGQGVAARGRGARWRRGFPRRLRQPRASRDADEAGDRGADRRVGHRRDDRHGGVLGRPPGEPVPTLYRRKTGLTKADPDLVAEYADWTEGRIALLHALMARAAEAAGGAGAVPGRGRAEPGAGGAGCR